LWRELLEHHLADAPHLAALGPARTPADSWRVRRSQYRQWLAAPKSTLLAAQSSGHLQGYAMIRVINAAGSWPWGDQIGVLETLVVSNNARVPMWARHCWTPRACAVTAAMIGNAAGTSSAGTVLQPAGYPWAMSLAGPRLSSSRPFRNQWAGRAFNTRDF
jgi:hypothetical protein